MKNNEKLANFQAKQEIRIERENQKRKDNRLAITIGAGALLLAVVGQIAYFSFGPGASETATVTDEVETEVATTTSVPDSALAEGRKWTGSLALNESPIKFELYGDLAPQATANFLSLVQSGFYESVGCHRLTTAGIYVLQCGDPSGNGTGGPGYNFGPIENAPTDDMYLEGTLAMARVGGDGSSMGSQFFIVYGDSQIGSDAAGGYTVFGKITSGLDSIKEFAAAGTSDGSSDGAPASAISMSGISVE